MLTEGHGFIFPCQYRRDRLGAPWCIRRGGALAPLGYGFGVDAVAVGERL